MKYERTTIKHRIASKRIEDPDKQSFVGDGVKA